MTPARTPKARTTRAFSLRASFEREYWSYAFKILIPLLIILAMAYLVFFLPAAQLDTSASVAMTALLSCMAYNVAVSQNMPEIGYLVLSDKFFIATYVLLLLTLAQDLPHLRARRQRQGRTGAAHRPTVARRLPVAGGRHLRLLHRERLMLALKLVLLLAAQSP